MRWGGAGGGGGSSGCLPIPPINNFISGIGVIVKKAP